MTEVSPSLAATPRPRRAMAMGLMVLSSIGISFGGLIVRSVEDADAWQLNFYRSLFMALVIGLLLALRYRGETVGKIRSIGWPGLFAGSMVALAGIGFLQALTHTTVANTLFTLSAIPFITAGLAWVFLRERLRRATLVTMLVAGIGIAVMVVEGLGLGSGYGNFMALLTACGFSGFAVIVRRNRQVDMLPTVLVASVIILVISLALRIDELDISWHDILLCFLWGGILSGIGNHFFIVASRHLVAAELTLFMLLEFALGPVWVWLFVGEVPTRWSLVGGLLVITAVTLRALLELRSSQPRLKRGRPSPT